MGREKCVSGMYFIFCSSFTPFWHVLKALAEKLSNLHLQLLYAWQDLIKDVQRYTDEQNRKQKSVSISGICIWNTIRDWEFNMWGSVILNQICSTKMIFCLHMYVCNMVVLLLNFLDWLSLVNYLVQIYIESFIRDGTS